MADMEIINPSVLKAKAQTTSKGVGGTKDFNAFLGAVDAMGPTAMTSGQVYGDVNSATVLSSAFSGVSSLNAQSAGYVPTMAGGYGKVGGGMGMPGAGNPVVPGTEGFSQADMINTMNQNNLHLLELQAMMQSNMQEWNTKSNILSADHRARMAMIEKFTARG